MAYRFNDRAGRYINERGQFVSESRVRVVVDRVADAASTNMATASQQMIDGNLSVASWQATMMHEIKLSHVAAVTIAHGGASQMTPAAYLEAARSIKAEYAYLRGFAADVASGAQPMNRALVARARQYGQASRVAFERAYGRGQQQRGYVAERNVLAPAEHCSECRAQTAKGWVAIGSLVPVGRRLCRSNCRCRLEYSRAAQEAAA